MTVDEKLYTYRELIELYLISDSVGWQSPHTYAAWKKEVNRMMEWTRQAEDELNKQVACNG
jgi:hypothetical protein